MKLTGSSPHFLFGLLAAVAILVLGWLFAWIIASVVGRVLRRTTLDHRLGHLLTNGDGRATFTLSRAVSTLVFYVILLLILVAFFQRVGLTTVSQPLSNLFGKFTAVLPHLASAAAILLVAWLVATAARLLVSRVLKALKLEQRFATDAVDSAPSVEALPDTLANVVYWIVLLLFLPAVLGALSLQGLLQPVQGMVNEILAFLPSVFAAAIIVLVGWLVARIVQRIVSAALAAMGLDRLGDNLGVGRALGERRPSSLVGLIVFVLILVPVAIAGLNALHLQAVTQPASVMLGALLAALPKVFAAVLILALAYLLGRFVASLTTTLLTGVGFNSLPTRLGIHLSETADEQAPSRLIGQLVLLAIMLFAVIEGSQVLGFALLAGLAVRFTAFLGHVALGLFIFALGLYLSAAAQSTVLATGAKQARLMGIVVRGAILFFASAMALQQMGVANGIITTAFTLLLGAAAVAAALAFGLGGREVAAQLAAQWLAAARGDKESGEPSGE